MRNMRLPLAFFLMKRLMIAPRFLVKNNLPKIAVVMNCKPHRCIHHHSLTTSLPMLGCNMLIYRCVKSNDSQSEYHNDVRNSQKRLSMTIMLYPNVKKKSLCTQYSDVVKQTKK